MLYAGINGGCETFRVRGEHAFAGNAGQRGFLLGAEGSGRVVAVGPDVSGLQVSLSMRTCMSVTSCYACSRAADTHFRYIRTRIYMNMNLTCSQVGDVVACNTAAAFTQYAVAKAVMCTPVPAEAAREAVALTLSALTACAALEVTGGMAAGETVAVTAAAGGTGHFAVQLAKLAGCRVIAFCGSDHKISVLKDLGADVVINYRSQDVDALLTQHAPGGLDLVYEGVGGQLQRTLLRHLAPNARVLQVGYISEYPHTTAADAAASRGEAASDACSAPAAAAAAGSSGASGAGEGAAAAAAASLPPNADLFWRGMSVDLGDGKRVIGQVWPRDVDAIRSSKRRVFDLHRQGKLKALIDESATFQGVEAVPDAVEHMLRGGHVGKVVVRLSPA